MKSVVVTGASTGIGWGCVKVLVAGGYRVFGSVRRQGDAERLSKEFGAAFRPLIFDVTDRTAVSVAAEEVGAAIGRETLAGLVNNAGVAVPGPLIYLKIDAFARQLEVNLAGPLLVTQAFAPLLGIDRSRAGPPGRIVMISSVGGRNAPPFLGAYSASKFGLEGLSESLRRELMLFGVEVIVVAPGPVATPIWEKGEGARAEFAETPYAASLERLMRYTRSVARHGLPPERIGETVKTALTATRPKTRYTVAPEPMQTALMSMLPKRFVDRLIARRLGLMRSAGMS